MKVFATFCTLFMGFAYLLPLVSCSMVPSSAINQLAQQSPPRWAGNSSISDAEVIANLSSTGNCMYYDDFDMSMRDKQRLACYIWCVQLCDYGEDQVVDWNCTAPATIFPFGAPTYADQDGELWVEGNCVCDHFYPFTVGNVNLSRIDSEFYLITENKQVQDLQQWGYDMVDNDNTDSPYVQRPYNHYYKFTRPGRNPTRPEHRDTIGIFGFERDVNRQNVLYIGEIHNNRDARPNRPRLNDQILAFWKNTPTFLPLTQLNTLFFETYVEETLDDIKRRVYQKMGQADEYADLTIRLVTSNKKEQQSFEMLRTRTKFGEAAQRAIDQYQEFNNRQIVGFRFSGMIDFEIFFDGATF